MAVEIFYSDISEADTHSASQSILKVFREVKIRTLSKQLEFSIPALPNHVFLLSLCTSVLSYLASIGS